MTRVHYKTRPFATWILGVERGNRGCWLGEHGRAASDCAPSTTATVISMACSGWTNPPECPAAPLRARNTPSLHWPRFRVRQAHRPSGTPWRASGDEVQSGWGSTGWRDKDGPPVTAAALKLHQRAEAAPVTVESPCARRPRHTGTRVERNNRAVVQSCSAAPEPHAAVPQLMDWLAIRHAHIFDRRSRRSGRVSMGGRAARREGCGELGADLLAHADVLTGRVEAVAEVA